MNIKTMILALMCTGVFLSSPSFAGPEGEGPHNFEASEKRKAKKDEVFKELNLTEEQKKALEANKSAHRQEAKELSKVVQDKMDVMREELQKETLDVAKINQVQAEMKDAQAKMVDHRLAGILEVRKILSAEQFKKFNEKMKEHKGGLH